MQVNKLCLTISDFRNPFLESCSELRATDSHLCTDGALVDTISTIEAIGKSQYDKYVQEIIVNRTKPMLSTITKNKLPLFRTAPITLKSKLKEATIELKSHFSPFSHLFITFQVREGNIEEFFSHENHPWPPSLSQHGKLRLPNNKSELLDCLSKCSSFDPAECNIKVFDGAAVIHSLGKGEVHTFADYTNMIFMPWTQRQLLKYNRIDIVWDSYKPDSLKEATRQKWGKGSTKLPATPSLNLYIHLTNKFSLHLDSQ